MAYQLFDSSVVKKQADGDVVLSSYLDDGEELVKSSFHVDPPVEYRDLELIATRATFTSDSNRFVVTVPASASYPVVDEILAGKYRAPALTNSFGQTDLYINDGENVATFSFVAVFRNAASAGNVDLIFDLSGGTKYSATTQYAFGFVKALSSDTVIRVRTDENTVITRPTSN